MSALCVCASVGAAHVQGYPWDHHLREAREDRVVQQLQVDQYLPSHQSLLSSPEEDKCQ